MAKGQALEFSEVGSTEDEEVAEEEPIVESEFNMLDRHPFEFNMLSEQNSWNWCNLE